MCSEKYPELRKYAIVIKTKVPSKLNSGNMQLLSFIASIITINDTPRELL